MNCECGKPAPYDGGKKGVCECCSTCEPAQPKPPSTTLPNEGQEQRRQALIRRLCRLQAMVANEVFGYQHAADCFCLTLNDGSRSLSLEWPWSNDGKAVEFIEQAVAEKIARASSTAGETP